ncbi:hypothetical protein TI05_03490 [Achromatium sp. WMS3]|nr:hypothetical protein TI05_03490 [Achromatium sp. WMS3]
MLQRWLSVIVMLILIGGCSPPTESPTDSNMIPKSPSSGYDTPAYNARYYAAQATATRKRKALVIGNASYPKFNKNPRSRKFNLAGPLTNPLHDAQDLAAQLQQYGFQVKLV